MSQGGARPRSGPAPDPGALRRDRAKDTAEWIDLPASGREGPAPEWPLPRITVREKILWEREWARPQALQWEANGLELEVALYIRLFRIVEGGKVTASDRSELRRCRDALGLTMSGLLRNRWRIVDESAEAPVRSSAQASGRPSAKDRLNGLTVIDGGG